MLLFTPGKPTTEAVKAKDTVLASREFLQEQKAHKFQGRDVETPALSTEQPPLLTSASLVCSARGRSSTRRPHQGLHLGALQGHIW